MRMRSGILAFLWAAFIGLMYLIAKMVQRPSPESAMADDIESLLIVAIFYICALPSIGLAVHSTFFSKNQTEYGKKLGMVSHGIHGLPLITYLIFE